MLGLLRQFGLELARQLPPVAAGHVLELRRQVAEVLATILLQVALTAAASTGLSDLVAAVRIVDWLARLRPSSLRRQWSRLIRRIRQRTSRRSQLSSGLDLRSIRSLTVRGRRCSLSLSRRLSLAASLSLRLTLPLSLRLTLLTLTGRLPLTRLSRLALALTLSLALT